MRTLVVMGVAGSGKSLIGAMLAERLGGLFEDADDFHPPANKAKMAAKIPLTDEDRWPWLERLRARMVEMRGTTEVYVLACSALKERYRELLRGEDGREVLKFVYLRGERSLIGERLAARTGHFMPASLLDSQFATLEEPGDEAWAVGVDRKPEEIVAEVLGRLG